MQESLSNLWIIMKAICIDSMLGEEKKQFKGRFIGVALR